MQQPDYSAIRDEIESHLDHKFFHMKQFLDKEIGCFAKVLFTNAETVIVQHLELRVGHTRFVVQQITYPEWHLWFKNWIGPDKASYFGALRCDQDGMRMYGANV